MPGEYDVVVLGGGPAGSATAMALRHQGVEKVLLVEAGHYDRVRIGESIPPDTRLLMEKLGLWEAFSKEKHAPCMGSCSSWGSDAMGYNDFMFNPYGNGWHLDRRRFDAFLAQQAQEHGVELRMGSRFENLKWPEKAWESEAGGFDFVLGEDEVRTRFVVDATGPNAHFSRKMGSQRLFNDRLICAIGYFDLEDGGEFTQLTMLEAVENGWWYAARLPDGKLVAAFASDPEILKAEGLNSQAFWMESLQKTRFVADALSKSTFIKNSFQLSVAHSFHLDKMSGPGWIAVGDAASAYDPISSQGIYKALSDGLEAGRIISSALNGNSDFHAAYQESKEGQFQDYLQNRNHFYDIERRWQDSPFWKRRRSRLGVAQKML